MRTSATMPLRECVESMSGKTYERKSEPGGSIRQKTESNFLRKEHLSGLARKKECGQEVAKETRKAGGQPWHFVVVDINFHAMFEGL